MSRACTQRRRNPQQIRNRMWETWERGVLLRLARPDFLLVRAGVPGFRKRAQSPSCFAESTSTGFPLFRTQLRVLLLFIYSFSTIQEHSVSGKRKGRFNAWQRKQARADSRMGLTEGSTHRIHRMGPVFHEHGVRRMTTIGRKKNCRFRCIASCYKVGA